MSHPPRFSPAAKTDHPWRQCLRLSPLSLVSHTLSVSRPFPISIGKQTNTLIHLPSRCLLACTRPPYYNYTPGRPPFVCVPLPPRRLKIVSRSTKQAAQRRSQNAAVVHLHADGEEDDCLHRIPYASLIGSLLCVLGVVLFAIMMSWAFNATAEQTRRSLKIDDWPWLDKVQVFFIVIAVLMGLFSLFFLCIGFTATGGTRETMYKDDSARCGGKAACVIAMFLDFLLIIAWLFIISIVSWLCIFYYFFDRLCINLPGYTDGDCIDLHVFWPLVSSFANSNLRMCGGDVQQFCALTSTAYSWYVIGWVGCVLIILGILLFFGIHASNYAHIGNANRYVELGNLRFTSHRDDGSDPRRPIPLDKYEVQSTQWSDSRANYSMRTSTSRQAEHMSDSVSQQKYDPRRNKKPVY